MYQKEPNRYIIKEDYCILQIQYKDIWYDFLIDLDDVENVKCVHWRVTHKKHKVYAVTGQYKKDSYCCYLHSFILNECHEKGYEVNHINGNEFGNRKKNLRIVKRIENIRNVSVRDDNKIGIRGVCFDNTHKVYIASLSYTKELHGEPERYYFKNFKTLEEAVWCRKTAEEYFGIEVLNRNPIAIEQFDKLDNVKKKEIEEYTIQRIKERLAYYESKVA